MTQSTGEAEEAERGTRAEPIVRVFGGMGVDVDGSPISIGGPRQRRLLALLAIRTGSTVGIDWLEEHLWSDGDRPEGTVDALRTYVSRLRSALPEAARGWIVTEQGGYRLSAPDDSVEHLQFSRLRAEANQARTRDDPQSALEFLDEALALWRGQPFIELEDLDWARAETEQLGLDRLEMLEERWEAALALGRHTQITGELAVFTTEHNLRDRAARQYALALHRSGRTVEALRVIADHRRVLLDVGGLDPSPAVVELEAALLSGDRSLLIEKVGRPLRGYRLIEEVGTGAFSVVWRGVQPSVEREVAIKQIRPELASQPEFIRRFEAEARMVARIEHPHIVPLIDFWRDPDSAYLVMRWLRGGTLERRLDDGPMSVDETLRLVRQIGDALTAAHAHGVVHRDVKAANVLFDEQGNAFLADFGIALEATLSGGPEAALSQGSPAYASPEQIRREPLGPEADVFSLGVVLFESLAGSLPFRVSESLDELIEHQLNDPFPPLSEFRADLPQSMVDAVATATAKDPGDRYRSVDEFLHALDSPAGPDRTPEGQDLASSARVVEAPRHTDIENPYMGLRAFDDGDADRFFGREGLVDELVRRLGGHTVRSRCVVVVGPSGSGKSSVVRAGLMPALRGGALAGSSDWFATTMVPGTDPFESLEAALLRIAVNPPPTLIEQLRGGKRGILRGVRRCLASDDDRVVLVVDQFEEIFTGRSAHDADDFLEALSVTVEDPASPLRLVATLRADYFDRPLEHPTFARILRDAAVTVTPLAADELERAIVEPARRVGVDFEPGLVARLAAETHGQPSPLPLLQYTLSELFDRRRGAELTIDAYDEIGGVAGALASRADALYAEADDGQRRAIRSVFGRLTNPGEGSADLRRRVPIADLGVDPASAWVVERFGAARLLTFDREVSTREPTVEVAHEALLREWPRLVEWLRDDADVLRSVDAISVAATTWDQGGREVTDLYRGGRLDGAVDLARTAPERLRPIDDEFIEASRRADDAHRRDERRRVRRLRRLVAATATGLVIALVAGGLALRSQRRAETAAERADLATLISRSAALTDDEPDIGVLLALEAHRRKPEPETKQAVLNALGSAPTINSVASHPSMFDREGCASVGTSADGLTDFGVVEGQLATLDSLTMELNNVGPAPEQCVFWGGDEALDRRVVLVDGGRRVLLSAFDGSAETELEFDEPLAGFTDPRPTNRMMLIGPGARSAIFLDHSTGEVVSELAIIDEGAVSSGTESPDASLFALTYTINSPTRGVTGETVVLDIDSGEEIVRIETVSPLQHLEFDDTANELIAAEADGSIVTIDLGTGETVATVEATATAGNLLDIGVLPDGRIVAVSAGQAEIINRRTGPIGRPVELRDVVEARVRADGLIKIVDSDDRVDIIDLNGNALVRKTHPIGRFGTATITDGVAAVADIDTRHAEIIDLSTGERSPIELNTPGGDIFPVAEVRLAGNGFVARGHPNTVARWEDGRMVNRINLAGRGVVGALYLDRWSYLSFHDDGSAVAQLVDVSPGNLGLVFEIPAPNATIAVHPSPDAGLYVVEDDGTLLTYDAEGTLVDELETDLSDARTITIDPATGRLAIGGSGVVIVDPATGLVERLRQTTSVSSLGFAQPGDLLAIGGLDGTIRLWDIERGRSAGLAWRGTGQRVVIPFQDDPSADSLWVLSGDRLLEIPLDPELWIERACDFVGRDLTQAEWDLFVPGGGQVQSAC